MQYPLCSLVASLLLCATAQAADSALGRNLAATCANCHGTEGRAVEGAAVPGLAGIITGKAIYEGRFTVAEGLAVLR